MNTNNKQPKPFDLQAALDGAPIMTRDGCEVVAFNYFDAPTTCPYKISAIIKLGGNCEDVVWVYTKEGKWDKDYQTSENDLVMKPKEPKTVTEYILWGIYTERFIVRASTNFAEIQKAKDYQESINKTGTKYVISETIVTLPE